MILGFLGNSNLLWFKATEISGVPTMCSALIQGDRYFKGASCVQRAGDLARRLANSVGSGTYQTWALVNTPGPLTPHL